jgi:hypothetical protein
MKVPWKTGGNANAGGNGLGLDSIRFDTLGLERLPDEPPDCRYWLGPNLELSENWFAIPPDLPSLQEDEIRATYDTLFGDQPDAQGRMPRPFALSVHRETPLPVVEPSSECPMRIDIPSWLLSRWRSHNAAGSSRL